jgi:SSS family transporter
MPSVDPSVKLWCWFFLISYTLFMFVLGLVGMKRVKSSDDFATARSSYGPYFLSFALVAATASGGTFIGIPALSYTAGFSILWYAFCYPVGVFLGFFVAMKAIRRSGKNFGTRSIPEYLGYRFDSEFLRIIVSFFSLLLLFYLAAQLLSAALMFNKMLGLDLLPALIVTSILLLLYIATGGAHGDILTDAFQGFLMVSLALVVVYLFFNGVGVTGGFPQMMNKLYTLDKNLTQSIHPTNIFVNSWWKIVTIVVAHMPIGLLPHIGNKFWALKNDEDQNKFFLISFVLSMILPAVAFGGILARAVLGDVLFQGGLSPNDAIPLLFVHIFPPWIASLVIAGILSAVMSTADGLIVSTSQIFANDLYRLSFATRYMKSQTAAEVDRVALIISRVATIFIIFFAGFIAWKDQSKNIAILMWNGIGGLTAANAGPLFLGIMWARATKAGALAGFIGGGGSFLVLKTGMINEFWFAGSVFEEAGMWLVAQSDNPFACSTIGAVISVAVLFIVSLLSTPPSELHLKRVFS